MKKIILILILMLVIASGAKQSHAQTYDSVASFTATTALLATDIVPTQIKVSNKYTWRKITGASLWSLMRDTTQAQLTTFKAAANTWSGVQTFSARPAITGATFGAGSYGKVTFADSVSSATLLNFFAGIMPYNTTSFIGSAANPYLRMYAKNFVLVSTSGSDSVYINIDGGKISVDSLQVTGGFDMPDSATFGGIALSQTTYQPTLATDSIITLTSIASSIVINPPASMGSPGIEKILMTGAGDGQVLVITNRQALTIVFQDSNADGNLYLATDFSMGQWQSLTLMYNSAILKWIELSRSSN